MGKIKEKIDNSLTNLLKVFNNLSDEDKARFLQSGLVFLKEAFDIDAKKQIEFPEMESLALQSQVKRWKPRYIYITINYYESKDHRRVLGRLKTFAKKHGFEIIQTNVGRDHSDSYVEIAMRMRNNWYEYQLVFDNYIDQNELFDFLDQFEEIQIGSK